MSDGFGKAFASELILQENDGAGEYNITYPIHSENEIDEIMSLFMGIDEYIKMPTLPYDGIHHIDMHMKLLDEETLLVAEYPEGVADGPQINANLEYVLSNFTSKWGTPFNVIRIPSPPSVGGNYPDNNGAYRTYTNAVFVNNTVILPTYREQYDTTALRIWNNALPGYNIVGIDCDNSGANIISQSGAIHCITHAVGVQAPLLISHQPLRDTYETTVGYTVNAYINHRSGIESASVFYKTTIDGDYIEIAMSNTGMNQWSATIPAQAIGNEIFYYIHAEAVSGKTLNRPMPAPEAYWKFKILGEVGIDELSSISLINVFPNPASAITCIDLSSGVASKGNIRLIDMSGRIITQIYNGNFLSGNNKYFFDASVIPAGIYRLIVSTENDCKSQTIVIK